MSGSRLLARGNVVPMSTTTPPPPTIPPLPSQMWSGGCVPSGDLGDLIGCYYAVQQASSFIGSIMVDQIDTNPAVIQAVMSEITASKAPLPVYGVTDGTDAQPGQVGEWVAFGQTVNFPTTIAYSQTISMGVLQAGDWDVWSWAETANPVTGLNISLNPLPVGFSTQMQAYTIGLLATDPQVVTVTSPLVRALLSVPTLCAINVLTNQAAAGPGAGSLVLWLNARRRR